MYFGAERNRQSWGTVPDLPRMERSSWGLYEAFVGLQRGNGAERFYQQSPQKQEVLGGLEVGLSATIYGTWLGYWVRG